MSKYYETITFDKNMIGWVYKFSDYSYDFYDIHWHRDIELTYVFKGTCKAAVNGRPSILEEHELFIVNSGDTHYFNLNNSGDICDAIVVILPHKLMKQICPTIEKIKFQANPFDSHYGKFISLFDKLKELFDYSAADPYVYLKINSITYEIIYMLFSYFSTNPNDSISKATSEGIEKCKSIIEYIDENHNENITLDSLSEHFNITKEYISRLMKNNLDMTFKEYLTDVRLNNAYMELLETQESILQISMNNGFPNCKSFITAFSKKYSLTPQAYRNSYLSSTIGKML